MKKKLTINKCEKCGEIPTRKELEMDQNNPMPGEITLSKEGLGKRGVCIHKDCGGKVVVEEKPEN